MVDRILSIADDPEGADSGAKLRFFQLVLLMHVAVRTLPGEFNLLEVALSIGLLACFAAVCIDRRSGLATGVAAALLAVKLAMIFPQTPNHGFLGHMIASDDRFASIFQLVVPGQELARLRSLASIEAGAGPFSVDSPVVLLASNGTYVFEMLAPLLLLARRTRTMAAVASMLLIAVIQMAAREVYFGLLFVNLVLLFPAGAWNRLAFPGFVLIYLVLAAAGLRLVQLGFFN